MTRSNCSSDIQGLLSACAVCRGGTYGESSQPGADVLSQLFKQRSCLGYTYFYLGLQVGQGVDLPEAGLLLLCCGQGGAAADGDHRYAGGARRAGNAHGRLAQKA